MAHLEHDVSKMKNLRTLPEQSSIRKGNREDLKNSNSNFPRWFPMLGSYNWRLCMSLMEAEDDVRRSLSMSIKLTVPISCPESRFDLLWPYFFPCPTSLQPAIAWEVLFRRTQTVSSFCSKSDNNVLSEKSEAFIPLPPPRAISPSSLHS